MRKWVTGPARKTCTSRTKAMIRTAISEQLSLQSSRVRVDFHSASARTTKVTIEAKPDKTNNFQCPQAIATPEISSTENTMLLYKRRSSLAKPMEGRMKPVTTSNTRKKERLACDCQVSAMTPRAFLVAAWVKRRLE